MLIWSLSSSLWFLCSWPVLLWVLRSMAHSFLSAFCALGSMFKPLHWNDTSVFFFSRSSGGTWILLRRNSTGISCWRPMGKWSQEVRAWASLIGGDEKTGKVLDVSCTFQQTCLGCVGEGIHGAAIESWGVRGQACKYGVPIMKVFKVTKCCQELCECVIFSNSFNLWNKCAWWWSSSP